ncbi:MAG: integrase [Bacteroidetes bacterium]|nr:MAG: integrase [Bacteroidota bacterium]
METNGTIRIIPRKDKADENGQCPLDLIYQLRSLKSSYRLDKKYRLPKENWDANNQRAIFLDKKAIRKLSMTALEFLMEKEANDINNELTRLKEEVKRIEREFPADKQYSTLDVIKELQNEKPSVQNSNIERSDFLFDFIDQYIKDNSASRVKGSLSVYKSLKSHLQGYQSETRKKVTFSKIDRAFFQSFQNYLFGLTKTDSEGNTSKALNNITIAKQLSTLKTFLTYARQDIEFSDKYRTFKINRKDSKDLEIIALTSAEYTTLLNMNLTMPALSSWERVRDVFCFSCNTGLRYSDLKQLRREHIQGDWIDFSAIKTGHKSRIPLTPDAKKILAKYQNEKRPLPVISNQKSNDHLRKICELAGINTSVEIVRKYGNERRSTFYPKYELISMHCGRKSFATISAERGMKAEVIMKIGGWTDWKSFKRYLNVTDETMMKAVNDTYGPTLSKSKSRLKAV